MVEIKEYSFNKQLQPFADQEKARLKEWFSTDDVLAVGMSFVFLVDHETVSKNSYFSKDFDETDYDHTLSEDFAEFMGVRTAQNADRLEIRRKISAVGTEFFESLGEVDENLMYLAGEFMAANEDYVLNHSGEQETNGTLRILKTGFKANQKRMLERVRDRLQRQGD